jgi:hypothetical protein
VPVVPPGCDSARHHGEDGATLHAEIASAPDHNPARRATRLRRSTKLALAKAVAVQSQLTAGGTTGGSAVNACPRSGGLYRRRRREPPLDVERVMNDSWRASGRFQQGPTGSTTSAVLVTPSASPISASPTLSSEVGHVFYINHPDRRESPAMMRPWPLHLIQPASIRAASRQLTCSLTASLEIAGASRSPRSLRPRAEHQVDPPRSSMGLDRWTTLIRRVACRDGALNRR